ncbi:MAG TPA: hypothetical protein VFT45_13825 [Longimicrobium sp.]|nr:hypothetical protein [Longimicrobium sp.]
MADEMMTAERLVDENGLYGMYQDLRARADAQSVPSGILVDVSAGLDTLDALDGSPLAPAVEPRDWTAAWRLLTACALRPMEALADPGPVAEPLHDVGVTPIFVADFAYERLRPRAHAHLLRASAAGADALPPVAHLVAREEALFATALRPDEYDLFTPRPGRHYGLQATFVLPATGYRTNTGRALHSATLHFGDGGAAELRPGDPVRHDFAEYGPQRLSLTLRTSDGVERVCAFTLEVAPAAPGPSTTWELTDGDARGTAWVYYGMEGGTPRTRLKKPVIIAEGFPGGRTIDELWPLVNQQELATTLRSRGQDLIILGFKDGTRAIADNARLYVKCLQRAISEKQNEEKIAAGGASMGGLIARYALCSMEAAGQDHQTRLFFTVDTPHDGANIPVSVQAFVQLYSTSQHGGGAVAPARLMASTAAQQMLLLWIPPYSEWKNGGTYPIASPRRNEFLTDLRRIGWMPQRVRRIGVADGVATGVGNGVPEGAHAFWMECTAWYWANLWAVKETRSQVIDTTCGWENWKWQAGAWRIDGAPGGTRDSWKETYDGVGSGVQRKLHYGTHCFVSSVSACAVSAGMYDALAGRPSELHAYKASSTTNQPHVAIDAQMRDFLIAEITASATPEQGEMRAEPALMAE